MSGGVILYNRINGSEGGDTLIGHGNADLMQGFGGDDHLYGSGGNDRLLGGAGEDYMDGGTGIDLADYSYSPHWVIAHLGLGGQEGDAEGDTLVGIENLTGSGFGDELSGDSAANVVSGGGGSDFMDGGWGNDTLIGGDGDDELWGCNGNDTLTGGVGGDKFMFEYEHFDGDPLRSDGHDMVTDFKPGEDKVWFTFDDSNNQWHDADFKFLDTNKDQKVDEHDAYCMNTGKGLLIDYGSALHAMGAQASDGYHGALADTVELKGVTSLHASDFGY